MAGVLASLLLLTGGGALAWYQLSRPAPAAEPKREAAQTLTFFSAEDKQQLHAVVDAATSLEDFDSSYYNTFADLLEKHGSQFEYSAPEIYSQRIEEIDIDGSDPISDVVRAELTNADLPLLKSFAHIFTDEYTKYPLEYMDYLCCGGFIFSKGVRVEGDSDPSGGIFSYFVVYDITGSDTPTNEPFIRELIHHEIGHYFERVYKENNQGEDLSWPGDALEYTEQYDIDTASNFVEHPSPGFVTGYAQTNESEDLAEVYAYLFTSEGYPKLEDWSRSDPALSAKVAHLKKLLRAQVAKMDDDYYKGHVAGR